MIKVELEKGYNAAAACEHDASSGMELNSTQPAKQDREPNLTLILEADFCPHSATIAERVPFTHIDALHKIVLLPLLYSRSLFMQQSNY